MSPSWSSFADRTKTKKHCEQVLFCLQIAIGMLKPVTVDTQWSVKIDPWRELTSAKVSVKEKERKVLTTEDFHSAASTTFPPHTYVLSCYPNTNSCVFFWDKNVCFIFTFDLPTLFSSSTI